MSKFRMWYIATLFLSGLCITLYPFVSNLIAESNATRAIDTYQETVAGMEQQDIDATKEAMQKYNEQLKGAFTTSQEAEKGISYVDLVDVGESIGFIDIPKIEVNLPIYSGTSADVLQKGVGHIEQSSFPTGGEGTHCVLTGHRGMPNAVLFTDLDKMQVGDLFYLHVLDEILAYRVDQILVVLPNETEALGIVEGKDYCTLVTCTPYAINTHRLLVRGVRTEYIPPDDESGQSLQYTGYQSASFTKRLVDVWPWITVSIVIAIFVETFIFWHLIGKKAKRKGKKKK